MNLLTFLKLSLLLQTILTITLNVVHCQRENFDPTTELSRRASADVNAFWGNITEVLETTTRQQSLAVLREWNQAVVRGQLKSKVSKKCLDVVERIIKHPLKERWSAEIIDSMKLSPPGVLSGTTTELGDFDQCLAVDGTFGGDHFVGKYCLATVNLPRSALFSSSGLNVTSLKHEWLAESIERWYQNDNYYAVASAVCFPSICKPEEVKDMITAYYPVLNSFDINVTYCQSRDEPRQYDQRIWIALFILALPWILIIPGTLFELFYDQTEICEECKAKENSLIPQILLSFSLLSNSRILFRLIDSNDSNNQSAQFQFVHGIRALASIFIIIAHNSALVNVLYHMRVSVVARHPKDFIELSKLPIAQPFYNGALVVLTFFLISGMFLSFWTASRRRLRLPFSAYITLRWLRYTPPLIGMLCLTVALEFLGSGPTFHHDLLWPTVKHCYEGWASHLLFYSNYKDMDKTCGIQTWYISVEMQLHILAFIFLVAYTRSRKLAFYVAIFFIAIGMALIVLFVALGRASLPLVHVIVHSQFAPAHDATRYIFFSPSMNLIPYFIGVLVGQALLEGRSLEFSSQRANRLAWAATAFILIGLPMASLPNAGDLSLVPGNTSVGNAIAFAVSVLLWSLANGWLVYNCVVNGEKLAIAKFLSAKIFQPLSRLSFALYLVHLMTIWFNVYQTRVPINSSAMNEIYKLICLSIAQSFILAYLLYVSFEAPSVNLIKLFINKQQAAKELLREQSRQSSRLKAANGNGHLSNGSDLNNNGNLPIGKKVD